MKKFGSSMKRTGQTLSRNLTLPIIALGAASLKAFDTQAKAIAQVESGLKSTGEAAGFTSEQLQKMASDLQKKTIFGDEEILKNATSQLLTFTNISGEQFARTQKAALDLATRLDGDLKSASIQLGKALNDPIANLSALSRSGIQFSEEQKKVIKELAETNRLAEAQTIILDELDKQYGGSAEAAAQAGLGGIQQLKNSLGDLGEEFGAIISENIGPFIQKIKSLVESLKNASDEQKRNIVVYSGIAAVVGPLLIIFGQLIISLGAITKAVRLLSLAIASNPLGLFLTLLATAGAALIAFGAPSREFNTYQKDMKDSIDDTNQQLSTQEKLVNELNDATKTSAQKDLDKISAAEKSISTLKNTNKNFQDLIDTHKLSNEIDVKYIESIEKTIKANDKKIKSLEDSIKGFKDYKNEVRSLTFGELLDLETRVNNIADAIADANLADAIRVFGELDESDLDIGEEEELEEMGFNTSKVIEKFNNLKTVMQEVNGMFTQFGMDIRGVFVNALQSTDGFFVSLIDGAKRALNALLANLAVMLVFNALLGGTKLGASMGLTGLKEIGGIGQLFNAKSMAIGDSVGSTGGLRSMINTGGSTEVFGVISGADILLSSDRAQANRNRTRGY